MQLALLILISLTYLADDATSWTPWAFALEPWPSIALSLMSLAGLHLLVWAGHWMSVRSVRRHGSWRAIRWSDLLLRANLWAVLIVHGLNVIIFGWLDAIRALTGDLWIVDELVAMAPPLLAWTAGWASYYPIHRHITERLLIGQLDRGEPVYPIQSRLGYALSQSQLHLGLILAPALLILGWVEAVHMTWLALEIESGPVWLPDLIMVLGVGVIFLMAPVILTTIWSTAPLAHGDLRDRLEDLLTRHGVRLRNILVWNTRGTMINGAILGIMARVRYVLLSDALLNSMKTEEIEAVMAHEVGHAKRHHLPWLALCLMASLAIGSFITDTVEGAIRYEAPDPVPKSETLSVYPSDQIGDVAPWTLGGTLGIGLIVFGWVSRRFERQADTFAVQHLSGAVDGAMQSRMITAEAAQAMAGALARVAALNYIHPGRRSWRHGSIQWRQNYLHSLIGQNAARLVIDRTVRRVKIGAVIVLAGAASLMVWPNLI